MIVSQGIMPVPPELLLETLGHDRGDRPIVAQPPDQAEVRFLSA